MFVGIKEASEQAKDYCNECYKTCVLPVAKAFLGEAEKNQDEAEKQ
jgi:hypothetical protein